MAKSSVKMRELLRALKVANLKSDAALAKGAKRRI